MKRREKFEEELIREDIVEYFKSKNPKEIEADFGTEVSRMIGYEQKNSHHCYDLWEHTLRTVEGIDKDGLTDEEFKTLRVAAFFHDIGKPNVSKINPKTGQQVFYGHAQKSVEVAKPVLEKLGYSEKEIEAISFYIAHHDDFISYKSRIKPFMKNHEFIREINERTVAEKVLENRYDFEAMGYNKDEIRAIVYELAHGEKPDFRNQDGPISIPVNIEEVREKTKTSEYVSSYDPTLKDYIMLLKLCRADAGAQSEVAQRTLPDGKKVIDGTKTEKIENIDNIEKVIEKACEKAIAEPKTKLQKLKEEKRKLIQENSEAKKELEELEGYKGNNKGKN